MAENEEQKTDEITVNTKPQGISLDPESLGFRSYPDQQAEDRERYLREVALNASALMASNPTYTGHAGHVVAIAQIFEKYLKDGKLPTSHELEKLSRGTRR
jgi:hypothetical protein